MSSQESSGSSGTSKLSLSLSQDTIDYMFNSVNNMPGVSDIAVVADITSNSDFTNIAPRDLSVKKDDAALQEGKDDQEQCYDLSTTSRVRDGDAIQQQVSSPGTVAPSTMARPTSVPSPPSVTAYPGDYDFQVSLSVQSKETKAVDWIYSEKLHKVFVRFEASCPFLFSSSRRTPSFCIIRAMPMFVRPQHMQEVVRRCPHHAGMVATFNNRDGGPPSDHLIRCDHKLATYCEDPHTGFHSIVVPYDVPTADTNQTSYLYQFMCFSSCVGGLNRRPFQVVFTLEDGSSGQVLGRSAMEVRICACPGRDRQTEEKNLLAGGSMCHSRPPVFSSATSSSSSSAAAAASTTSGGSGEGPAAKRQRSNDNADNIFTLSVCGRYNFALLRQMRDSLEVSSALSHTQFQQLCTQQETRRASHPDSTLSLISVSSSSTPTLNGAALPRDPVQEQTSVEQAHSTHNRVVSADTTIGRLTLKRRRSGEIKIETWLNQHKLSSCIEVFKKLGLIFMKQINNFKLADMEKLRFSEDDLAKLWLAFSRLQSGEEA